MKILILGGDGMLGHQLLKSWQGLHDARVTVRRDIADYSQHGLFNEGNTFPGVDVRSTERLIEVLSAFRPEAVVNAVGIINKRPEATSPLPCIEVNSLLPHRLAVLCRAIDARLVHISTDCVFSGKRGNHSELDDTDADELYGRSKLLGEVTDPGCLTLRTSIIGRELGRATGLLEWFLAQDQTIHGYRRAIYSGLTTMELARVIEHVLLSHPDAEGLYHVSSDPISKYDLLCLLKSAFGRDVEILPNDEFVRDMSLDSTRFRRAFDYTPPTWRSMVTEVAAEPDR